ncbi:hypothetical protein HY091_00695 [Candidatus Kaiserbacteria bacterium]|nr:hypothetical protein [Candidatus Kaiserbacteria bacterium]
MRLRALLLALAPLALLAIPLAAHATGIPYFGPIVPTNASTCAAGWQSLIQLINNLVALLITLAIVFVAPIMIAYSGFLYVVNPVKPEGRSEANKILRNTVVGIVIALAAWLIVDAILTALTTRGINAWTSGLFNSGYAPCLLTDQQLATFNQSAGQTTSGASGAGGTGAPLLAGGSGACDPSVVAQGAAAGGQGTISSNEAGMLACFARYESACGTSNNLNYNWGNGSSAAGALQVTLKGNSSCYDNAACEAAAGTPGVPLNCASGFDGHGNPIPGSSVVGTCTQAAANLDCSSAAAACVYAKQGPSAWTADSHSAGQQSCVNQYGGG